MHPLHRLGDLRFILFFILLLLVLYTVVGSQETLPSDDYRSLVSAAYQDKNPFLVPYTTLTISQGSSQTLRAALYGQFEQYQEYHLGLSCVDQQQSPYLADFTFAHFPQYVHVPQGRVTLLEMVLAVPLHAKLTAYLCRLELGHPVPAQGYAQARTNILASKDIYIFVVPRNV
ncbi:hypothetical protein J4410_01970 [Candidatus Woesearchaeota archaeon]|nr:hypothetical protein [Candidatus Woesearchaeota archaeon]